MGAGQGPASQIVTRKVHHAKPGEIRERGLPEQIPVRLVRLVWADGTIEVLVTHLLDEQRYPTTGFGPLYNLRWGVETFYARLKTRLTLQNFSGYTVEAVKQDFFAAVFLTGLSTFLAAEAQLQLGQRTSHSQHTYQVNHAVSFNASKNHAFELLDDDNLDLDTLCQPLPRLFLTNPTCSRPQRQVPRRHPNYYKRYVFHRHKRKVCF